MRRGKSSFCEMMTRRTALAGLGAVGAAFVAGCEIEDVARLVDDIRSDVRLGVLANVDLDASSGAASLEKALRFYRQEGVDAVAIIGVDPKDGAGRPKARVHEIWQKVFLGDRKVRLILEDGRQEVNGFAFDVLRRAPERKCETLAFHGEGRNALTDGIAFFDREYNVVYAGSMSPLPVPEGFSRNGRSSNGSDSVACAQGLLVTVYSDGVCVRRLDFTPAQPPTGSAAPGEVYAEDVAPELRLPRQGEAPPETVKAPEFWADTTLRILPGFSGATRVYSVSWPAVQRRFTGARAFCYEVSLRVVKADSSRPGDAFRRGIVLTERYHQSELRDILPVGCVFLREDFSPAIEQKCSVVVSVTPIGPTGERGRTIFSEPFQP